MIPLLATVDFQTTSGSEVRLWLPLFLAWLILLPFVLLLLPVIAVVALAQHVNPLRAFALVWQILAGLRGVHTEVAHNNRSVFIRIL